MFLSRTDAITSYKRLAQSSKSLPSEPTIRSTTLLDELYSMERGTRPGLSRLAIYSLQGDLEKADELMGGQ